MRRLNVNHLTRVEGHGAITIEVDGKKVKRVRMEIIEGPRLFETLAIGKLPSENLNLVSRICAICTLSHRYASIRAIEKCLGIVVPKKTFLLRELMHHGEMIESHSLHIFLLTLPDLFGYPSAPAMADKYEEYLKEGLELKKFGNKIMEVVSGRVIHGENPVIGGFGKFPTEKGLLKLSSQAGSLIPIISHTIELLGDSEIPKYLDQETQFVCVNPPKKRYGFSGDSILISDGKVFDAEDYKKVTNERVVDHSYAKRALYNGKPYTAGAIARINNLDDRLSGMAAEYYRKYWNNRWKKNPIFNNTAQAIEILYCLEKIQEMIDQIITLRNHKIIKPKKENGTGTGLVEAPRGILFHSYEIKNGRMEKSDIITPTGQNLDDIERYMRKAAEHLLEKNKKDNEILRQLEIIARAYDPCISCSSHLIRVVRK